jgi:hypothetical protein
MRAQNLPKAQEVPRLTAARSSKQTWVIHLLHRRQALLQIVILEVWIASVVFVFGVGMKANAPSMVMKLSIGARCRLEGRQKFPYLYLAKPWTFVPVLVLGSTVSFLVLATGIDLLPMATYCRRVGNETALSCTGLDNCSFT